MGFASEQDMVDYIGTEESETFSILGGIVFDNIDSDGLIPDEVGNLMIGFPSICRYVFYRSK